MDTADRLLADLDALSRERRGYALAGLDLPRAERVRRMRGWADTYQREARLWRRVRETDPPALLVRAAAVAEMAAESSAQKWTAMADEYDDSPVDEPEPVPAAA